MATPGKKIVLWILERSFVVVAALAATVAIFMFLPVMQAIGDRTRSDALIRQVAVGELPPPPPPPPEQEQEEEEPPEPPPELVEDAPPLDLSQLELALNPGYGEGLFPDFTVNLGQQLAQSEGGGLDEIFSLGELDQRPRVIFQRMPTYPPELRRSKRQGTVYVIFIVNKEGRVENPKIEKSTDPAFEKPALDAVRQWRFEPGTRNGEKVQFKMRIPITFNAG
jgi:protein TonB